MDITLSNVCKTFRDADRELRVIDSLSANFRAGESVAIVGKSGIGKSTLLHLMGGLDTPSTGSVTYGDLNISKLAERELSAFRGKNVGFIFQFHHLLPEFSAIENVSMPLIIAGITESQARISAEQFLDRVGLADRMTHRPGQLSGGEQQRVAVARALVHKPKVVLADEPTGNLDVETARDIQQLLLELNRELANTLIVVTHNPELVSSMSRALEMQPGGRLIERN